MCSTKATGPKLLPPLITFRGNCTRATRIHTKDTVRQQMLPLGVCYIHKRGSFARICCIYVCNFLILQYSLSFRSFILYLCQQWLCHLSLFFCVSVWIKLSIDYPKIYWNIGLGLKIKWLHFEAGPWGIAVDVCTVLVHLSVLYNCCTLEVSTSELLGSWVNQSGCLSYAVILCCLANGHVLWCLLQNYVVLVVCLLT